ncbi:hypothetical protein P7M20_20990, partial [Vibrio parahaemolyticus]|nr:hypothetical protein [Vibrio parahaemolyticus]
KHNQHLAKLAICAVYMKSDKYKHWEKRLVRKDKGWLSDGHKKSECEHSDFLCIRISLELRQS